MTEAATTAETVPVALPTGAALIALVTRLGKERTKIEKRLAEIEAQLPALKEKADAEYEQAQALAAIETTGLAVGTTVDADYGRKDKRRTLRGTVIAFQPKTENTPALYAVQVGSGVDTEVIKVAAVAVKAVTQ